MRSHHTLSVLLPLAVATAACSDLPAPTLPSAEPSQAAIAAAPACVDFEPPLPWVTWGFSAGQPPLTFVHAENGIRVFTEKFFLAGGGTAYRDARVGVPPVAFSAGQAVRTLHINLIFDFTGIGFTPSSYTFDYLDMNGPQSYENLRVNASGVFIGELDTPPAFLGVPISVSSGPFAVPPIGDRGTLKFAPVVNRLMVGGQDLWIDHVCANP
ncbi:MAG TPA: hypothetical protein VHG93_18575 [Longimicrobium sp.]|nr:hypothetical protein [Longimicrobium sp.]